jgi:hypothetical protein
MHSCSILLHLDRSASIVRRIHSDDGTCIRHSGRRRVQVTRVLKRFFLLPAFFACGGAPITPKQTPAHRLSSYVGDALVGAVARHDAAAIASYMQVPFSYGGLWFADPECARQFPTQAKLDRSRIPAFATCLAALPLHTSKRRHQLNNIEVLEYAPGIEVELQFATQDDHVSLTWLGYAGRRDASDALPTITEAAFEALRDGPLTIGLDDATRALLTTGAKDLGLQAEYAWLKICLDATGSITGVHAREITSYSAERVFVGAAQTWHFRPFEAGGQPMPVCAMTRVAYPGMTEPEVLPIELAPDEGDVARFAQRAVKRVSGDPMVTPNNDDKARLADAHVGKVVGSFKVCFDGTGEVQRVTSLKSTGLERYDAKITATVRGWKYKPVLRDGQPVGVCTAVTFIYTQS